MKEADTLQEKYEEAQRASASAHKKAIEDILTAIYGDKDKKYTEGGFGTKRNSCSPTTGGNRAVGKKGTGRHDFPVQKKTSGDATECGGNNAPQVSGGITCDRPFQTGHSKTDPNVRTEQQPARNIPQHAWAVARSPDWRRNSLYLWKIQKQPMRLRHRQKLCKLRSSVKIPGTGIPRKNNVREAIEKLKTGQTASVALRHHHHQLQNLALTARHTYETAKLSTEGTTSPLAPPTLGVVEITETDTTCEKKEIGDKCTTSCREVEGSGENMCKLDKKTNQKAEKNRKTRM
ncbi:unnamed protein product [Trypanosoma brucei gambiense DAL972]|uniref:Uncharacterized protein n=1 Tax=Trypanosoma brucei gambiense (strain MHOM/CI/86/DAL972) TaxID=679716 RepID=C9ZX45_TRYB9|nr:uncharacterized protein [Trypanosoma brucei gambiense DAL972]CBH13986.1 unnamed protein product [Trypanosoma brucei gambiense DAL972]|eukprot:XP_011776260.1 uncharacterized protein [Trypanosoma brucei gambiense DAL972]